MPPLAPRPRAPSPAAADGLADGGAARAAPSAAVGWPSMPRAASPSVSASASSIAVNSPRAENGGCFSARSKRAPGPASTASSSCCGRLRTPCPTSSPAASASPIDPSAAPPAAPLPSVDSAGSVCALRNPRTSASVSAAEPDRHRPRPHRRQQPPRVDRRQQEETPWRWLLQQLEQRVGRLLTRLLRHQPLGVAQMKIRAPPSTDVSAARRCSSRTVAIEWLAIPSAAA